MDQEVGVCNQIILGFWPIVFYIKPHKLTNDFFLNKKHYSCVDLLCLIEHIQLIRQIRASFV